MLPLESNRGNGFDWGYFWSGRLPACRKTHGIRNKLRRLAHLAEVTVRWLTGHNPGAREGDAESAALLRVDAQTPSACGSAGTATGRAQCAVLAAVAVFDEHAAELGELFAAPAAVAVHNAQVLARALALTIQLQAALSSRPVIDQAVGILLARTGPHPDSSN